jgi:hypothetical protein
MSPVVEGITKGVRDSLGPGTEFLFGRSTAGYVRFWNPTGPHGSPFVVVVTKPEIGDVFPTLVSGHFIWREMGVIVDNRQIFRSVVKKLAGCLREEKEIVIKVCSSHGERLGHEVNQVQARIS